MTRLMSTSGHTAYWSWEIDSESDQNINIASELALSTSEILRSRNLMNLSEVRVRWHRAGQGYFGYKSLINVFEGETVDAQELTDRILASQPMKYPDAEPGLLGLSGPGVWIDSDGEERKDHGLIDISFFITPWDIDVTLGVRHDIWSWFDFSGIPHPEIYQKNAPRLTSVIKEMEELLGIETTPGEPTYFATPERYGIARTEANEDGTGFDSTGLL